MRISTGLTTLHEFDQRLRLMHLPLVGGPADFHLVRLGQCQDFAINFGPVRTNFYQVVLPTRAQFSHRLNAFARASTENTLMFGAAGFTASFINQAPVEGFAAWFKPEFLHAGPGNAEFLRAFPFFQPGAFPFLPLHPDQVAGFVELYERIGHEYEGQHPYRFEVIRAYLTILLLRAKHLYEQHVPPAPAPGPSRAGQATRAFLALVAAHGLRRRTVQYYAGELCITAKHLSEAVKQVTGRTAHQHIAAHVLLEAKTLLLHSGLSVAEIAHELRFHDPAHFFKFFKGLTGSSPTAFRAKP